MCLQAHVIFKIGTIFAKGTASGEGKANFCLQKSDFMRIVGSTGCFIDRVLAEQDIADAIKLCLKKKDEINMIFAAAPSQNDTLSELLKREDIPWNKINAFHMDEYIGLKDGAPQSFGIFLKNAIFGKADFKSVQYINGNAEDIEAECARYSKLLTDYPTDIVCLGIGENGHIAFNDPGVADFHDKVLIKTATLDEVCCQQQVNDGCFATIDDVPKRALTLTIPALTSKFAQTAFVVRRNGRAGAQKGKSEQGRTCGICKNGRGLQSAKTK